MKIRMRDGRSGTVVEEFEDGYSVLLDNKSYKSSNFRHHKTEYIVWVRKGDER